MTVETTTPLAEFTVSGIGPYGVSWRYAAGALRIAMLLGGERTEIFYPDWSVSPIEGEAGDIMLSPAAAVAWAGAQMQVSRETAIEQGWAGVIGERERGLEAQLDMIVMRLQEMVAALAGALRQIEPQDPVAPEPGAVVMFDASGRFAVGPQADAIPAAQAAAESAIAASGTAVAAAAAAATFDPALYLTKGGNLAGLADAAAARSNLGLDAAVTITDWNSIAKSGSFYGDSSAANRPASFPFVALATFLDANNGVVIAYRTGSTSVYIRRKSAGTWTAWAYYGSTAELGQYQETQVDDGTKSSGTYTPSIATGNWGHWRKITNGGAFTLAAPSDSGSFSMVVMITNSATAGAITMTGFAKVTGNPFTTTSGHKFRIYITKDDGGVSAFVEALQ